MASAVLKSVSYTHLDVYKRQIMYSITNAGNEKNGHKPLSL